MRDRLSIIVIIIMILSILNPFIYIVYSQEEEVEILDAELYILDDVEKIEFGEESTINLRFKQLGFNWTKISNFYGKFWLDFFRSKILFSIIFKDIRYLLGYNSVVFETEIIGDPPGWEAWVSPGSLTNFTGDSVADIELHVKVSRPTTINTAKIRIIYTAYGAGSNLFGIGSSEILISTGQYHLAEINAIKQHIEASPDTIIKFPINVTNRGNYDDTFGFEVSNASKGFIASASGYLTLESGETGQIDILVLTPDTYMYDPGTMTYFNISAYSIYEPSKKFNESISVKSKGFLTSEMFLLTIVIVTLIIIFLYFIFYRILKRKIRKI